MLIALYCLLLMISLALWAWLISRIWRFSALAAGASFFLMVPALYWCYKLWDDPEAQIRAPAIANLVVTLLLLFMSYQIGSVAMDRFAYGDAVALQKHPELAPREGHGGMDEWCRKKHNGSYDHDLGTCVETAHDDPAAVEARGATYAQVAAYFKLNGLDGEFETTPSKADDALLAQPEIAGVASYNLYPLSMQQPVVKILVCGSATACADYQRNSAPTMLRNANILLDLPATVDDARIQRLQQVFMKYRAG